MRPVQEHLITARHGVREVLARIDKLPSDGTLFIVDDGGRLIGSVTDGDIRRGIIKGMGLEDEITKFMHTSPKYFRKCEFDFCQMRDYRACQYRIIPVLDCDDRIVDIVNFRVQKSYLPIDAVIMAGGKGTRLHPLTLDTPKPLLKVGGKPIVEYSIDRLRDFGIRNVVFTIGYLGQQLVDYFENGASKGLNISYLEEERPLGTIGSVKMIDCFKNDYILVMNSDLLTNVDYEDMFREMLEKGGDMVVASSPYEVQIPYGVIETNGGEVVSLTEKPTYTYYSNSGIYIIKKDQLDLIPKGQHFNATDLIKAMYSKGRKVVNFPILDYWLDIGKPHDYEKAQKDIKHIKF